MRAPPRTRAQSARVRLLARGAGIVLAIPFLVQAGGRPVALIPQAHQVRGHIAEALAAIQVDDLLGQAGVLLERGARHLIPLAIQTSIHNPWITMPAPAAA